MTDTLSITWHETAKDGQTDAVWFYGGSACVATATLSLTNGENYSLDIYCDGETRFDVPYLNEDGTFDPNNYEVIRYANEWEAIGVTNDDELNIRIEEWYKHGVEIHRFNSWFDCYVEIDGVSEHIDAVTHTTADAEDQALAILLEVASHGGWKPYLNSLGWDYKI